MAVTTLTACTPMPQTFEPTRALSMDDHLPPMRTFANNNVSLPTRPNSELLRDFLDLSFRMESGRPIATLTRFEGPISVRVTGPANATLVTDLRALLARMQNEAGIDIFLTGAPEAAITIQAIPRAELTRAVPRAACFVVPRVSSWEEFKQVRRTPQV
ncbi:MAG: DUF2927 domain-containing protein, partial [Marivivens sp.]|nr:DUF2927 domain-containing protein [Marivivens sp.]